MKVSIKQASLGAALALAAAATAGFAAAPAAAPIPPPAAEADAPDVAPMPPPGGHGMHRPMPHGEGLGFAEGPRGFGPGGPLPRELRGLDLSDAQQDAVDEIFVKHHREQRELFKRERDLHRSLATLDPQAKDYVAQSDKLAEQAGQIERDQLRLRARVTAELVATLTPEQAKQLQARRAERAERHAKRPQAPPRAHD
ncbi:Spy/CpxP family protein refolding chaperone [Solimonas flava]|uniref:Spy/CpxP family protein refolding chaperone n=1 Tax=Solimonas flava TaxID=415849 RepID=UPI000416CFEB|nr:Spy/CpxP family protein refolding chaperone [Solimonas flava]